MRCFLLWCELTSKWDCTKESIAFPSKPRITFAAKSQVNHIYVLFCGYVTIRTNCGNCWSNCHSITTSFQILTNVGLFLRPVEEIWCVLTRMVAIYAFPEQIQFTDHHIWILIQTFIHHLQLPTTPLLQDLWFVGLVTKWMKTTSVWVSSRTLYIF